MTDIETDFQVVIITFISLYNCLTRDKLDFSACRFGSETTTATGSGLEL